MDKISAIQMTSTANLTENLSIVESLIKTATQHHSRMVVLPEMFPIMGVETSEKLKISEEFGHGPIQDFLSQQAKKNSLWIVGGTIPIKCKEENKVRAACLLYDENGIVKARYDKMHLFDVIITETESYQESATTEPGDKIVLVDTPLGKLGLSVCYDIRFPELYRSLFNQGAEIFAIPAAFTMKTGKAHWEVLARSRAIENFCYVVGACQTGVHKNGRSTYGHSLIINPWGEIINSIADGVGVITAEIDLEYLRKVRQEIPVGTHQKIFFKT